MAPDQTQREFRFATDPLYGVVGRAFAVDPGRACVTLPGDGTLEIHFGPWLLRTPLTNVASAVVTGPYNRLKTIGPPHLSLSDRGITFATDNRRGVCISFLDPVGAVDPLHLLRHPSATVTVADPEGLVAVLVEGRVEALAPAQAREELHDADRLRAMTASELRDLAHELGLSHRSSLCKAELVQLISEHLGARVGEVVPVE